MRHRNMAVITGATLAFAVISSAGRIRAGLAGKS